jgi:hypothetical protein
MKCKKWQVALILSLGLVLPDALCASASTPALDQQLSDIEKGLAPHRDQTGKLEGMTAVEAAQAKLEPLLKEHRSEVMSSQKSMQDTLRVGAIMCNIDPSYLSVDFLVGLQKSDQFKPALQSLAKSDQDCILTAIQSFTSDNDI